MIIDYDHNPALTEDQKLQSLKESVQMALDELTGSIGKVLALVESGNDITEIGEDYARWSNGLQVCWISKIVDVAINNAYGSLYQGTYSWTFSKAFLTGTNPAVGVGGGQWGTGGSWASTAGLATATSVTIRCYDTTSRASGDTRITAIAVGRWK